jgi:hypothetical protein
MKTSLVEPLAWPVLFFLATPLSAAERLAPERPEPLPQRGSVLVNQERGELIACAVVQHPEDKPCIDDWGQRVQAFVGCGRAAGGDAKMAGYFVFLVDVPTEEIHEGLIRLGAKPGVHCSIQEGQRRTGLNPETKPEDYLQGDPVVLSIFWNQDGRWIERPYESFVDEQVLVDNQPVVKPWTPHFVFHGSGAIYRSGTGCIACPCDCPGGIIADNRFPIYNPKPTVRFNWRVAPAVGTQVYVRIRPIVSR